MPFGGYKLSGVGRDKGEYALENYTQVKVRVAKLRVKHLQSLIAAAHVQCPQSNFRLTGGQATTPGRWIVVAVHVPFPVPFPTPAPTV